MCLRIESTQVPIEELALCLSLDKKDYGLSDLQEKAGQCPMCILAAIRQSKIMETYKEKCPREWESSGPLNLGWDFKEELKSIWATINEADAWDNY
jgi:hypothetical protein